MIEAPVSRRGPFAFWRDPGGGGFRVTRRWAAWRPPADRSGASRGRPFEGRMYYGGGSVDTKSASDITW